MVEVDVAFISFDQHVGTPIVVLKDKAAGAKRMLLIWIGSPEAAAIQSKIKGEEIARPMTHDLMKNLIENLQGEVASVCVHSVTDGTFFGQVTLHADGQTIDIDARPSDAIALALRFEAPIFVAEEVLEEHGLSEDDLKEAQQEQTKSVLENLDDETLGEFTV
jgi:bifunctional DNase/RNase